MIKNSFLSILFSLFAIQVGFARQVEVRLKGASITTTRKLIRLQDVAELSEGNSAIRQKLAILDLDEFSDDKSPIEISSEQISLRIALARIDSKDFSVESGFATVSYFDSKKVNQTIEQAIIDQVVDTYQLTPESIELKVLTPLAPQIEKAGLDLMTVAVSAMLPTEIPLGQRAIPITITDGEGKSLELKPVCKATVYREVVMIKSNVSRGEVIDESKVERVRRPVSSNQVTFASYEQVIGKVAQSDLQQNSVVSPTSLKNKSQSTNQIVMKRHAVVDIQTQHGNLHFTLKNARANENGHVGQVIEFLNPTTKKLIYAKVIDAYTAKIEK